MYKGITEYFKFFENAIMREDMRTGLMWINRLTDSAVFSAVAGTSAVTLILVLAIPYTHTPVLTG